MSLRCMVTGHWWRPWEMFAPNVCREVRFCHRDGLAEFRSLPHEWRVLRCSSKSNDQCIETKACTRCGETDSAPRYHDMGAWTYMDQNECRQQQQCRLCGHRRLSESDRHDWSLCYADDGECRRMRVCTRCSKSEDLGVAHDWGKTKATCKTDATCTRCGRKEKGYHQYMPVGRVKATDASCREKCEYCGDIRVEEFDRSEEPYEHGYFGP
jgi:hypothetical protein